MYELYDPGVIVPDGAAVFVDRNNLPPDISALIKYNVVYDYLTGIIIPLDELENKLPEAALDYSKAFPCCTVGTVDIEVFPEWWCVVISNADGIHNFRSDRRFDAAKLARSLREYDFLMGYNIIGFDMPILKMMAERRSAARIYAAAQMIIEQRASWWEVLEKFLPKDKRHIDFGVVELMPQRDPSGGESVGLKHIQAITGHDIVECRIAFDKEELTEVDKQEILRYCENDVRFTESVIYPARAAAVETDIQLAKMCQSVDKKDWRSYLRKSSNSKAAVILGCNNLNYSADEFELREHIITLAKRFKPQKYEHKLIYKWFAAEAAILNAIVQSGNDDFKAIRAAVRKAKRKEVLANGLVMVFGFGGQHGAFERYIRAESVYDSDVSSMYPSIMVEYGLCSRRMKNPEKIRQMTVDRVRLKKTDKKTADAYKQVLVSIFGAMGNYGGQLYDPKNMRAVCITGQLALLKLIEMLEPYCNIINTNTDGLFYTLKDGVDIKIVFAVHKEWQDITGLGLEINGESDGYWNNAEPFAAMHQFNVNNYHLAISDGITQDKGSATSMLSAPFSRGAVRLSKYDGGIIKKAVIAYLTKGTAIDEFVRAGDDFRDFVFCVKSNTQIYQDEHPIPERNLRFALVKEGGSSFTKHTAKSRTSLPNASGAKLFHGDLNHMLPECHAELIAALDIDRYIHLAQRTLERLTSDKSDYSGPFERFANLYPKWSPLQDSANFPLFPVSDPYAWEHHDGSFPACMLPDGKVWAVDIDKCVYPTLDAALNDEKRKAQGFKVKDFTEFIKGGFINKKLLAWLKSLDTYTELSASGRGIHCIVLADASDLNRKRGNPFINGYELELFNREARGSHCITLTGRRLEMFSNDIKSKSTVIKGLLRGLPDRVEYDEIDAIREAPKNHTQYKRLWITAIHIAVCKVQDAEQPTPRYTAALSMIGYLKKNSYAQNEILAAVHRFWDDVGYWGAEHSANRESLLKFAKGDR